MVGIKDKKIGLEEVSNNMATFEDFKKLEIRIGGIILAVTVVLSIFILSKGFVIGQIITTVLASIPLVTAGVSLIVGDRVEKDPEGDVLV